MTCQCGQSSYNNHSAANSTCLIHEAGRGVLVGAAFVVECVSNLVTVKVILSVGVGVSVFCMSASIGAVSMCSLVFL